MKAVYVLLNEGQIQVNPANVLFTQGSISSSFDGGDHAGCSIDETILAIQVDPDVAHQIPLIHVLSWMINSFR